MIATAPNTRTEQIAKLNDRCRQGFDRTALVVMTRTCLATFASDDPAARIVAQARMMGAVRAYTFPADGHPDRDRGDFDLDGIRVYFVIDYYDATLEYGSEDPADASITTRVLTIMLREDL